MFREKLVPGVNRQVLWKWWFLACVAGQINALGLLATGRFVSHVTGFATWIGVELGSGNILEAFGMMMVPLFFLSGAMISGVLIESRILRDLHPRFDIVMVYVALCLLGCVTGGFHEVHNFGTSILSARDYLEMALLCLAAGLINGAISSSSGGTVRVTHLTGATTDLGLSLTRWLTLKSDPVSASRDGLIARFRFGVVVSFSVGSFLATLSFLRFHQFGFLLPTVCSLYAIFEARRAIRAKSNFIF